eukprot:5144624-Prymnesium_polylepis.1
MGMRFFEPALAVPISVELVDDTARGSDDIPVPDAVAEHAVIDAPGSALGHQLALGPPPFDIPPFLPFIAGEMSSLSQNDPAPLMAQQAHPFLINVSHKRQTPEGARGHRQHKHKDRRRGEDKGTSSGSGKGKGSDRDADKRKSDGRGSSSDNGKGTASDRGYRERGRSCSPSRTPSSGRPSSGGQFQQNDGRHQSSATL